MQTSLWCRKNGLAVSSRLRSYRIRSTLFLCDWRGRPPLVFYIVCGWSFNFGYLGRCFCGSVVNHTVYDMSVLISTLMRLQRAPVCESQQNWVVSHTQISLHASACFAVKQRVMFSRRVVKMRHAYFLPPQFVVAFSLVISKLPVNNEPPFSSWPLAS